MADVLTFEDVKFALDVELTITSSKDGRKLTYNPWSKQYTIYEYGEEVAGGSNLDLVLKDFNGEYYV